MTEEILKVKNLVGYYKGSFGTVHAVDNVSLTVKTGEIVGIAGESGSGKSTLAELISGVPRPLLYYENGLIDIRGYDIYHIDNDLFRSEVLSQIVGYVPQSSMNSLNPVLKVKKFLLDVMKQRTKQQRSIERKMKLSIVILVEAFPHMTMIPEFIENARNLMHNILTQCKIVQKSFSEIYQLLLNIKQIIQENHSNSDYQGILKELEPLYSYLDGDAKQSGLKSHLDESTLLNILYAIISKDNLFNLNTEISNIFLKPLKIKIYEKMWEDFISVLRNIYINRDKISTLRPSWWEVFPVEITGKEQPPIPNDSEVLKHAIDHFEQLGLNKKVLNLYPHELSGGMKQRTVIAISTLFNPRLLIVDEPTSALDVTTQKKLLDLFIDLKKQKIVEAILFISHDIPTLRQICTRGVIMYGGKIVEDANMDEIIQAPLHPYTQALVGAIVSFNPDGSTETELKRISGRPPDLRDPPKGCRFHPRCPKAMDQCKIEEPPAFFPKDEKHKVNCWLYKNDQKEGKQQ